SCIGTALPLLFIVAGFTHSSALVGGFLLQLNGVTALIFALLLLGERIRLRQSLGILLLLLGSTLVVLKGSQGGAWTSGGLGYLSQQAGFRLLKAWEMAAIMQTIPLFSTIFALLLLHDTITLIQAIGGFLAVLGGIIVSLSDRKPGSIALTTVTPLQEVPVK